MKNEMRNMMEMFQKQQQTMINQQKENERVNKELEELKSQSKANNNKNESGEEDDMSQIDPTLDVVSDVSKMKIKQENIRTQVGNHEDTLDEHGNEISELKEKIEELERNQEEEKKKERWFDFI